MSPAGEGDSSREALAKAAARWVLFGALGAIALSSLSLIIRTEDRWSAAAVLIALAVASSMLGAVAGLLMGMPRYIAGKDASEGTSRYEPSTSLEQISDWLTKILIGIGIAEATSAASAVDGLLNDRIVPALGNVAAAYPVALATVVTAVVGGFYSTWLVTRLTLAGAFRAADSDVLTEAARNVEDENLREQLLEMSVISTPSARAESNADIGQGYEESVIRALRQAAPAVEAELRENVRPWDAVVSRGDRRVAVEVKHVTGDQVFLGTVRTRLAD